MIVNMSMSADAAPFYPVEVPLSANATPFYPVEIPMVDSIESVESEEPTPEWMESTADCLTTEEWTEIVHKSEQLKYIATANGTNKVFKYINSTESEYDDANKVVSSVCFNISRYGMHEHSIFFEEKVTIKTAIEAVEQYLSEPLTEDYYEKIKKDTFSQFNWKTAQEKFETRGAVLSDAIYLEEIDLNNGELTFFIGS
jgi:hypothetical protein